VTRPHAAPRLLAIGAHPDDVELAFGGLLGRARRAGLAIAIVDLTAGEAGRRGGAPLRLAEAAGAGRALGAASRRCLHFADGDLARCEALTPALVSLLRTEEPALVLGHADFDPHDDHRAAARALAEARAILGARAPAELCGAPARMPETYPAPPPTLRLQLDADEYAAKRAAIALHRSQLDPADAEDTGAHLPGGLHILDRADGVALHFGRGFPSGRGEPLWCRDGAGLARLFELGLAGSHDG